MSDFTVHTTAICASNTHWRYAVPKTSFVITYGRNHDPNATYDYDFSCTCPEYQRGGGYHCEHIEEAREQHCGWNSTCEIGAIGEDGRCPECSGELEYIRVAA